MPSKQPTASVNPGWGKDYVISCDTSEIVIIIQFQTGLNLTKEGITIIADRMVLSERWIPTDLVKAKESLNILLFFDWFFD